MKKIIFIGRSVKMFGTTRRDIDYIVSNLVERGHSVDLYDPKQRILMNVNTRTTTDYSIFPKWLYISKLYLLLNFFCLMRFLDKNKGKYDIVHAYYIREEYLLLPRRTKRLGNKLILHLFGSDINLRNVVKNRFKLLYRLADVIVVSSVDFRNSFLKVNGDEQLASRIRVISLPQDHFSLYKEYTMDFKPVCKERLGFDHRLKIVMVGTNSTENEQHEAIIEELKHIDRPEDYLFIFHLANRSGSVSQREKMLVEMIKTQLSSFNTHVITAFVSYEEMRDFRFATDIFLNFRKHDQLAASMVENNLAYADIITGSWLPYNDYLSVISVHLTDQIGGTAKLLTALNHEQRRSRLLENKAQVLKKYDTGVIEQWMELYE